MAESTRITVDGRTDLAALAGHLALIASEWDRRDDVAAWSNPNAMALVWLLAECQTDDSVSADARAILLDGLGRVVRCIYLSDVAAVLAEVGAGLAGLALDAHADVVARLLDDGEGPSPDSPYGRTMTADGDPFDEATPLPTAAAALPIFTDDDGGPDLAALSAHLADVVDVLRDGNPRREWVDDPRLARTFRVLADASVDERCPLAARDLFRAAIDAIDRGVDGAEGFAAIVTAAASQLAAIVEAEHRAAVRDLIDERDPDGFDDRPERWP